MTHFVRFAMVGVMVAGASLCTLAQDDDLDALLGDLAVEDVTAEPIGESVAEEPEAAPTPAEAEAPTEEIVPEAEEPADEPVAEVEPAEEPTAEEPADEPATEEPAAEEPATDEPMDDTADEPLAEEPAPEVVPVPVAEAEPAAEEEPAAEPEIADAEPIEEAEPAAEPEVAEAEPAEETEPAAGTEVAEAEPAAESAGEGLLADMADDTAQVAELTEEEKALNDLEMLIRLKNEGLDNHAKACLLRARKLMAAAPATLAESAKYYDEVIRLYSDAELYFREHEGNLPLKQECEKGKVEALYRKGKDLFLNKEYKAAAALADEVTRKGHPNGQALAKMIQEERNRPAEIVAQPVLPEYAKDEHKIKRLEIQERLRRATVYYHLSKFKEANDQLELILRDDPGNEEAIDLRARVTKRMSARYRDLKHSTHDEMISQVELTWTPLGALGRNSEELYNPVVSRGEEKKVDESGQKEAEVIMGKLQNIRIPEFSIRPPSTLADAVQLFAELSKAYDKPDLLPEDKGVSFVLNMGSTPAQAAAPAEEDAFASDDSASSAGLPPIQSISMTFVTIKEALDMVCEVTGAKYVIKGKTVMIVPASYVAGKMETRSYNVTGIFDDKVSQVSSELGSGSDGGSDWGMDSSASASDSGAAGDTKKLFMDLGVPFEGNASLVYLKSIGKIRVTNTPENLAIFERVLEELNVTPFQIEVEARFVEVSQTDLNSLGFEWQLNSDIVGTVGSGIDWASSHITGNAMGGTAAGGVGAGGNHVFRPSHQSGTGDANVAMHGGSFNNGMRFLGDGSTYANRINLAGSSIAPDDTFASFSAVFGRVDMTMILHMLAQRSDTDMLSSPKVVARSGMEAMMKVVTQWIYPTEFDVTELEEADTNYDNNNTSVTGGGVNVQAPPVKFAVEPQSFESQDVGVSLQVMPEVSQEGQMINLSVNPKVVEYLGDFDYGMQVPYIQYTMTGGIVTGAEVQYYQVSMPQPKFHIREVSTYLSVYNGATVVMGGLITETRKSFEDKIPVLGDLPFIGFLFRSTGEYSEKRNLLIFLTARLVDPAGRPLKTATDGRTGTSVLDQGSSETMSSTAK